MLVSIELEVIDYVLSRGHVCDYCNTKQMNKITTLCV